MLSRVRKYFQGAKFARMSSGTYCIIRDLGLVKGGKGMRHHEVLVTFSPRAFWRWIVRVGGDLVSAARRRLLWRDSGWRTVEFMGVNTQAPYQPRHPRPTESAASA